MDTPHIPGVKDLDPNNPHELSAHHQSAPVRPLEVVYGLEPEPAANVKHKKPRLWLSESVAYLPELFVSLWVLAGLHISVILLFNNLIDNVGKSSGSSFLSSFSYGTTIASIASIIVALPVWYVLLRRTEGTEKAYPIIVWHKWRRAFIGIFIVFLILAVLGILTALVYEVLSKLAVSGIETGADSGFPWRTYLKEIFAGALFTFTAFTQMRKYAGSKRGSK